jgi:hypothetical protein
MEHSESQFSRLFSEPEEAPGDRAPSSLKAKIYSALVREQQSSGPLLGLSATKQAGHDLCSWEKLIQIMPLSESEKSIFHCHICHARVLSEHFENPPIHWNGCPYVKFRKA